MGDLKQDFAWTGGNELHIDSWGRGRARAHAFLASGVDPRPTDTLRLEISNGHRVWFAEIPTPWSAPLNSGSAPGACDGVKGDSDGS